MNGMMVSLLIVAMTGTVVGQQATSTQFGGNDFGNNSDMSRFIAPFTLPITTQQIQGLMNGEGKLSSLIQPRDPQSNKALKLDVVDEIILFHEPNADRSLPKVILTPEKGADGVLRFNLTQQDLNDLQSKNFTYRLPKSERGLFNRVECSFVDANSGNTPTPDDGTSSTPIKFGPTGNTGQTRFGQQNTQPFQIGLPGPEPGDNDFMGPVAPPQFTNNPNTPDKWTPNNQNGNVNPAFQNANTTKNPWNIPQKTETPMERLRRQQAELVAQRQQQKEIDDAVAARELAAKRQNEIRDAIARQQQQNALNNRPPAQNPNQFTPLQPTGNQNNLVNWEQQLLAKQNEDKALELAQIQQQLLDKQALIKKQEDDFNFKKYLDSLRTNPIARNPVDTNPIRTTPTYNQPLPQRDSRQVRTGTDIFTGPVVEPGNSNFERVSRRTMSPDLSAPSPQRKLASSSAPAGTRSGVPPLSINGKNPANNSNGAGTRTAVTDRDRKTENFIYFMLLCSLGLNFYLAWISRGFYVRYHELADELRETFTSTT